MHIFPTVLITKFYFGEAKIQKEEKKHFYILGWLLVRISLFSN